MDMFVENLQLPAENRLLTAKDTESTKGFIRKTFVLFALSVGAPASLIDHKEHREHKGVHPQMTVYLTAHSTRQRGYVLHAPLYPQAKDARMVGLNLNTVRFHVKGIYGQAGCGKVDSGD